MGSHSSRQNLAAPARGVAGSRDGQQSKDARADGFPDPQKVDVLTYTPPKELPVWRMEQTFWEEKLRLVPDYDFMKILDQKATQIHGQSNNTESLVKHLTRDLDNDLGKVRIIMSWIGQNISYDVTSFQSGVRQDNSVEAVMRRKLAVCDGYSKLFQHFCTLAGIQCEVISGLSRDYPGYKFDPDNPRQSRCGHAWNRVQIKGQWYLCDATRAAGARRIENGREVFKRRWREEWFLSEPSSFLSSHLPMDSKGVLTSQQLVTKPATSLEGWNKTPLISPITRICSITPVSHRNGIIHTRSASLTLSFQTPHAGALEYGTSLVDLPSGESSERNKPTARAHERHVLVYTVGNRVYAKVRLPGRGCYQLDINIHAKGLCDTEARPGGSTYKVMADALKYQVVYKGKRQKKPFPAGPHWGAIPEYLYAGFQFISPKSAVITSRRGYSTVKVRFPSSGVVANFHKLLKCDDLSAQNMDGHVYGEKKADVATYLIRFPAKGEYRFELYFRPEDTTNKLEFRLGAAFLIKCKKPASDPLPYLPDLNGLCGPKDEFYLKYSLSTTATGSTLRCKDGRAQLLIKKSPSSQSARVFALVCSVVPGDGHNSQRLVEERAESSETDDIISFQSKCVSKRDNFLKVYAAGRLVAVYYLQQ